MLKKHTDNKSINRDHFQSDFSYFVIESVIQGNTLAEAYVAEEHGSDFTVVWDGKYSIFCGGNAEKQQLSKAVEFIKNDILTQQVRHDRGIVKIMFENPRWKEALLEGMQELKPSVYTRSVYRHNLLSIPEFSSSDKSIEIKRMDREMLKAASLKNVQGVIEEVEQMWGSVESFLNKGYGFCAIKDDCIAAWCTSEYMSEAWCGIGIETFEPYQQQGVATASVIQMLEYCKEIGKTPHWDCWRGNIASVKTAEKSGFEKLADYDIVFLRFA